MYAFFIPYIGLYKIQNLISMYMFKKNKPLSL